MKQLIGAGEYYICPYCKAYMFLTDSYEDFGVFVFKCRKCGRKSKM